MSKGKPIADKYEAIPNWKGSRIFAAIFASMINHPRWQKLSAKQQTLYLHMKLQKYGGKNNRPDGAQNDTFYFNWALASQTYHLYNADKSGFYKDIDALVEAGFIEKKECGRSSRTKNVYQYSDRWHTQ